MKITGLTIKAMINDRSNAHCLCATTGRAVRFALAKFAARKTQEEAVYRGKVGPTKAEGSGAFVAIPRSLQKELEFWRKKCRYPGDEQIVFPSRRGAA